MGERTDGDVRKALERLGEGIRRLRLEIPELRKAAEMVFDDHWADVEAERRRSRFTVIPGSPDEAAGPGP